MKTRRFVDSVLVQAKAGRGGNGCVGFRREKFIPYGGPDGGDGGRGGHVIVKASVNEDSLLPLFFSPLLRAKHGENGGGSRSSGHNGEDLVVPVPCGTTVRDEATGLVLGDLLVDGQELIVAKAGRGGRGNWHYRSPTHQAPTEHTDGTEGEEFTLRLDLKIIADVGLLGFPNAGKSSLLAALTAAHPKIAPYPFTTINPILGTVMFDDFTSLRLADIPGLIRGAHDGVGLGDAFLRHIERSAALVYMIDMAGVDGREPFQDYRDLRKELGLYNKALLKRPSICVANKMDLPDAPEHLKVFKRKTRLKPIEVSTLDRRGLDLVRKALRAFAPPPSA